MHSGAGRQESESASTDCTHRRCQALHWLHPPLPLPGPSPTRFLRAAQAHLLCPFCPFTHSAHFGGGGSHCCSAGRGRLGAAAQPASPSVCGALACRWLWLPGGCCRHGAPGGPHHWVAWQGAWAGDATTVHVMHLAGCGWTRHSRTLWAPPLTACSDHLLPCLPHHALVPPFGLVEVCQCGCCSHVPHLLWRMPLNSMPACTPAAAARRWHHRPLTLCPAVAIPRGPACQAGAAAPPVLGALLQPGVRVNVKSAALVGTLTYVGT